nr:type I-E CRISPR-associated protein Cse2/CasB [uncultured Agathobaculum sp.]
MREQQKQLSDAFFTKLNSLPSGDRAALKRAAGSMLFEADGQAMSAFFRCLPYGIKPHTENQWFATGCFYCMWEPGSQGTPLENILCRMKNESDSMRSRVAALLDQRWEEDGYLLTKLCRIIKMARQKGYCVDCAALLDDLLYWNSDSQMVQRKWARTMYQITDPTDEKGENT